MGSWSSACAALAWWRIILKQSNQLSFSHPRILFNLRSLARDFNSCTLIFSYSILIGRLNFNVFYLKW